MKSSSQVWPSGSQQKQPAEKASELRLPWAVKSRLKEQPNENGKQSSPKSYMQCPQGSAQLLQLNQGRLTTKLSTLLNEKKKRLNLMLKILI